MNYRGECGREGVAGWSWVKGRKWDNCNSLINKYIKTNKQTKRNGALLLIRSDLGMSLHLSFPSKDRKRPVRPACCICCGSQQIHCGVEVGCVGGRRALWLWLVLKGLFWPGQDLVILITAWLCPRYHCVLFYFFNCDRTQVTQNLLFSHFQVYSSVVLSIFALLCNPSPEYFHLVKLKLYTH